MPVGALRALSAAIASLVLTSCYVVSQGAHLVRYQMRAVPVERAAREADVAARELFARVSSVRRYAREDLGLRASDNYSTFVAVERDHLVDVVSAVRATSFERKEWWFPIVGAVPYRGYYRRENAERLAHRLREEGWDVIIRPVDAFSTLGYFRDPLFSFMTGYEEWRIAELIIHEMAHATLWLRGHSQFNEEFATFVGREGAREYLVAQYGAASREVAVFEAFLHDSARFREDILALRARLERLYTDAATAGLPRDEILARKQAQIEQFQREFGEVYEERYRSDRYRAFAEITVNNAYIDLFVKYTGNIDRFERFHARHQSLAATVEAIVDAARQWRAMPWRERPDPYSILGS